jgi:hypothetical protein
VSVLNAASYTDRPFEPTQGVHTHRLAPPQSASQSVQLAQPLGAQRDEAAGEETSWRCLGDVAVDVVEESSWRCLEEDVTVRAAGMGRAPAETMEPCSSRTPSPTPLVLPVPHEPQLPQEVLPVATSSVLAALESACDRPGNAGQMRNSSIAFNPLNTLNKGFYRPNEMIWSYDVFFPVVAIPSSEGGGSMSFAFDLHANARVIGVNEPVLPSVAQVSAGGLRCRRESVPTCCSTVPRMTPQRRLARSSPKATSTCPCRPPPAPPALRPPPPPAPCRRGVARTARLPRREPRPPRSGYRNASPTW